MELLFMVFMVVVSVMALFAVMVVFRDIVLETFAARRERERADAQLVQQAERIVALANEREARAALTPIPLAAVPEPQPVVPQPAPAPQPEPEPAPEVVAPEPVVEAVVEEEPVKEEIIEEVIEDEAVEETEPAELCEAQEAIAVTPEDMTGKISFSKGTQLTLEEQALYMMLEGDYYLYEDSITAFLSQVTPDPSGEGAGTPLYTDKAATAAYALLMMEKYIIMYQYYEVLEVGDVYLEQIAEFLDGMLNGIESDDPEEAFDGLLAIYRSFDEADVASFADFAAMYNYYVEICEEILA